MDSKKCTTVDEYLDQFNGDVKMRLIQLRKLILSAVPDAQESISYGMPAYKCNKKPLSYFAGYDKHIGFYATPNTHESFQVELRNYKQGKGSVQFPNSEELPIELIKKMILFRKELILNEK